MKCPYCGKSRLPGPFYAEGKVRRITYSNAPFEEIFLLAEFIFKCNACNKFFITPHEAILADKEH